MKTTVQPRSVDWNNLQLGQEDFEAFIDLPQRLTDVVERDTDWVTLFEETEERSGDRIGTRSKRVTKVRLTSFLVPTALESPDPYIVDAETMAGALTPHINLYRYELSKSRPRSSVTGEVTTPFVSTRRVFRGRHNVGLAAINLAIAGEGALMRHDVDPFGYLAHGEQVVRSVEWQGPFDQDRRRHEPISAGFLLEAKRSWLNQLKAKQGRTLWAHVEVSRTTNEYTPENEMNWHRQASILRP
ncbi:MAG: hypothetical protein GY788_11290 [bacterium]|nr:hypothetical protein [bacterium]